MVGTGDFTHPLWLKELKEDLVEVENTGLYKVKNEENLKVFFMITTEVNTVFEFEGKTKRIHHVIWVPSIEVAEQVNEALSKFGSLDIDGRPTLKMAPPELVEIVLSISDENLIFPAHIWTPWFSLFGAFSGFNSLKDCYQDKTHKIYALETGLSSDPPMNWRVSELDRLTILSNSDSHSYWPWRLGREANVFNLNSLTYHEIVEAIKSKNVEKLTFTVETNPAYGKYHWTGHRACGVSMPASEAIKYGGICPVCGKKMTKGVEERVEEIADRPMGYKPPNSSGYIHLLPLSEILALIFGFESPSSKKTWEIYSRLIEKFGNEYKVLLEAKFEDIAKIVGVEAADLIIKVRKGQVKIQPGYDGVYGKLIIDWETKPSIKKKSFNLQDFM
ncbi:MAG: DNA helicase UvrD [Candidatus Hecatellales archaeon ex4484_218]|nr:MAG: DNA helicase UvrD [Candidatus Hecatellales archaeon ex4484_218]